MAVMQIENDRVVAVFQDVETFAKARKKYPHLARAQLAKGAHPPGTLHNAGVFTPPTTTPRQPEVSRFERAIRVLIQSATPARKAEIEAILNEAGG